MPLGGAGSHPARKAAKAHNRIHAHLTFVLPASVLRTPVPMSMATKAEIAPPSVEVPREFHRRMAAIIDAVQTAMWQKGVHDLLGYSTDFAFGQQRGQQTLVLKSRNRSAYVRLQWDTVMGNAAADREAIDRAVSSAINELT
jgi:hypothetical protein